ncbi:hypothetical protein Esti_004718 [Eimeria stiedai]
MRGGAGESQLGASLPPLTGAASSRGPADEGGEEGNPPYEGDPSFAAVSTALQAVARAAPWAEAPNGWASPPPAAEMEAYAQALTLLAAACRSSACTRDAVLRWKGLPKGAPKREGPPRGPALLLHFCRVFCTLCCACLAEVGVEYGGPPGVLADTSAGASQGGPGMGGPPEGPSSEVWVQYGVSVLAVMRGGDSCVAAFLQRLVALLYPLTSGLCGSRAAAAATEVLETPEGAHCFCFLAALAAAAAEEEVDALKAGGAAAATPREGRDCTPAAAQVGSSSATLSSSSSSVGPCPLLLELLGAYEGPLSLPGVAAAAREGPLRGLHKAAQRGAAKLLGKAASLRDSAAAVSAWLVYHRLSSSSSSNSSSSSSSNSSSSSSSGDSSFSASNVRHLLALLIASVRNHLSRPLEQRVSSLCLREALKEPRMQAAIAGATHDAALALAAVCLQAVQALAAAAETAAHEVAQLQAHTQEPPAAAAAAAAAARLHHLTAAAPISEMLALLCASSPALRASVAARLDTLPPPLQPLNGSSNSSSSNSSSSNSGSSSSRTPMDCRQQQQQQQQGSQVSPRRGRSSAALSSSSLPALFYVTAWGDPLGCTYTSAFVELCVRSHGTRDVGRHLTPQQREETVAALAANTELLQSAAASGPVDEGQRLRAAACLCLLAALWENTEALGGVVEAVCLRPLSAAGKASFLCTCSGELPLFQASLKHLFNNAAAAAGEEAAQRGDTAELLRVLHVSLNLAACSRRHLPRSLGLLQRAAAALAEGPLCNAHAAAEAEEALLVVHKCCALSLPRPWGPVQPIESLFLWGKDTAAAAAGAAGDGEDASCPLVRRLENIMLPPRTAADDSWPLSCCQALAGAVVEETRKRRAELRGLQQSRDEAKSQAAQAAQRLAVTKEAHEVESSQLREEAARLKRMHAAEEKRLRDEASKLRSELEVEQKRGRNLVAEFQRLLDAKEFAIANLQSSAAERSGLQGVDVSEVSRNLQIQTAVNVKQKEELDKLQAKLQALMDKQQHTGSSLAQLNVKYKQLQEEKSKLQVANEKLQEESEQQFRQEQGPSLPLLLLILVMKALAEQQAENEALKEERMHASADPQNNKELRVQQLEQQLQQLSRDHESAASASSLRLVRLEEEVRVLQKENEGLKLKSRKQESTIEDLEKKLREAAEAVAGARAATHAKSELVSQMERELKEKENRLAVISAALRGS